MKFFKKKEKVSPVLVGLLQALGVIIYCSLISTVLYFFEKTEFEPPQYFGPLIGLLLLVFSAALMGVVVFGYPVYLALEGKKKKALQVILWTLGFMIVLGLIVVLSIARF